MHREIGTRKNDGRMHGFVGCDCTVRVKRRSVSEFVAEESVPMMASGGGMEEPIRGCWKRTPFAAANAASKPFWIFMKHGKHNFSLVQ